MKLLLFDLALKCFRKSLHILYYLPKKNLSSGFIMCQNAAKPTANTSLIVTHMLSESNGSTFFTLICLQNRHG